METIIAMALGLTTVSAFDDVQAYGLEARLGGATCFAAVSTDDPALEGLPFIGCETPTDYIEASLGVNGKPQAWGYDKQTNKQFFNTTGF